ncbi:tryptophan halogenase family protein [Aliiglaciecola litoralis]|uniref:Tryptophan 7-halogenase n=1 Tax=Aliiglaciecola litoralis TaxID=582857 RepID=A0ABP3WWD9_9ALTE
MKRQSIIILGGGTAGWMSANLLHHAFHAKGFDITLIESPEINIIGVGEGSTPHLKQFFNTLGLAESDWMPRCHATYKNGIQFNHWSSAKGYSAYFHPFPSMPDRQTAAGFLINSMLRRQGHDVDPRPDRYFLSAYLAKQKLSPKTQTGFPISINYGYHFDSALLGEFLKELAVEKGVNHVAAKITEVERHLSGDIDALVSENGQRYQANWFIDCSGFSGVLLQKTLGVTFHDFSANLFNDAAIALPSEASLPTSVQTISTALSNGWSWEIPLTHRTGNGYVYSSRYQSSDAAETELREKLGLLDADVPAKHLKMRVGQVAQHWYKNCLAVGLSQGFIEPLEATALHLVQDTLENFIGAFEAGKFSQQHQAEFNQRISARFEGIRDYIVCHYKVNNRTDTQYWMDNRNNPHISDQLQQILACWDAGGDVTALLDGLGISQFYPAVSWHCLLSGYGRFPPIGATSAATHEVNLEQIQHYIKTWAKGFIPHNTALAK